MLITILDHRDKQDLEDKIDNLTCTENTGLDFVFGLTDNKKMSIRTAGTNTVYLDIEKGCWLRFDSKITGRVHTTKEELVEQLGSAFTITDTTLTIELVGQQSLVFDIENKVYKIVGNQNLEYNYVIILGANNINVFGAAVTIANFDKLRDFNISLTEAEINSCKEFASLFVSTTGRTEPFVFFTDPHMATKTLADGDVSTSFNSILDRIKTVYDNTPTSTCVCGGDWLQNGNSKENASWVLGKIDGAMKSRFDKYINILGNHDTNYQGVEQLTNTALSNLWYSQYGRNYFSVNGSSTKFYIFDTGIDSVSNMDAYRWEQVDWFANSLIKDNPERSAILLHIGTKNYVATPLVDYLTQVASAFNSKGQLTLNGVTYNFESATGKLYFALAGHAHLDMDFVQNTIPVVLTTNLFNDEVAGTTEPTYDLVLADYGANKLHCVRVGTGSSRTFDMA